MTIDAHPERLHFQTEVKQLLDIVVHSLYSNKEIFLRELISNASDAIDKLRFEGLTDPALLESDTELRIRIDFDAEAKTITISDNGIGMSREEVIANIGTIAKSGTREFLSQLTGDQKKDAHLIGQFGVGFYSAFIVADDVTVITRRAGLGKEHGVKWESKGDGEYTIENLEKNARGTDVILHLKEAEADFLNDWRLRNIITKYSDHINIPIQMRKRGEDGKSTQEWETVNKATAIWTLPKSQLKPEQYIEFYKHIAHDFEPPLAWAHHKIEGGNLEYNCLLYVPSHAPFDLWQRDNNHQGLKLYVQRVFIMDQVEQFMPQYLRFIRGVLDTTSLPLNISREILQEHGTIPKLRSALVRHVLDLLDKLAKDEPEKYQTFWNAFGNVLKEGPAEDFSNRERIANLLRFVTTKSETDIQNVSLAEYVKRMKSGQKKIYYITAENVKAAKSSPHLEIFKKKDIEVIILLDRVDEWLMAHLTEYDGKTFQSVAKGDLSLDEIEGENKAEKAEDEKKDKENEKEYADLLKRIKASLKDQIKDVRISHRLIDSPVCLVREHDALGPQMERLLKAAGQPVTEVKSNLEINPDHLLIKKLNDEKNENKFNDWIHILYEEALLAEGSTLSDPAGFVQRLNQLWLEVLR